MEAQWLEDFPSVARTGSFSLLATERHITRSAFSRRIKSLEQWVGVALIDHSTCPTRLTAAGQQFLAAAQEATSALLNTRQELRHAARSDRKLCCTAPSSIPWPATFSRSGWRNCRWTATTC